MIKKIERLEIIAKYAKDSKKTADIGTDHAYLPIFLAANSGIEKLVLTDLRRGPLIRAKLNVGKYISEITKFGKKKSYIDSFDEPLLMSDLFCDFSFRLGDGLIPLEEGEVDTAIIAGMGGELIVNILSVDIKKTESIDRFILQPRTKGDEIRKWINENNFTILAENLARERGKICEIIVFSTKKLEAKKNIEQLDYLLENDNQYLKLFLEQKIEVEKTVLKNISKSNRKDKETENEIDSRIKMANERIEYYSGYLEKLENK